ncbi:MAG: hypothetical protein IAI50_17390 [Candidatus Eremiobacteraeota bacterium]|nr:hypothetical protein [Candidatus Eremiobacteraeota bacterium]
MDEFNFNVYETFERIHQLLGSSEDPEDASAMDRAEYQLQHNKLVEGLVELLQHAAKHKVLSLDIGDYDHDLEPAEIGVYRDEDDEPAANHTVAIRVPEEFVPDDDAVSEAIEAFNLPTVETTADLALAAMAHSRFVNNDSGELDERLFDAWASVADRLLPRVVPSVQRLDAAGLLRVYDVRTKESYFPASVSHDQHGSTVEIAINSREKSPVPRKPKA